VRKLDGACNAGTEADAVIGSVDVVVHRLRDRDDVHPFVMQPLAVAECVVASDRDQHIDSDVLEVLEHILRDVVDRLVVAREMRWQARFRQMTWPRPRGMEKSPTRATGAIHLGLRQLLNAFGVIDALVAVVVDESRPPAPKPYDAVPLAQRANRYCPDCRIETGDVAAAGENRNCRFVIRHAPKLSRKRVVDEKGLFLRLDHSLHTVLVYQLQRALPAFSQYLDVRRVGLAADHKSSPHPRGPEFYIRSPVRTHQAQ
jgi:hypothetical protein